MNEEKTITLTEEEIKEIKLALRVYGVEKTIGLFKKLCNVVKDADDEFLLNKIGKTWN